MIAIGTRAHGEAKRRQLPNMRAHFYKSEWLEAGDDATLSPTAFLVEQPPIALWSRIFTDRTSSRCLSRAMARSVLMPWIVCWCITPALTQGMDL